jgi:hypothetical protein
LTEPLRIACRRIAKERIPYHPAIQERYGIDIRRRMDPARFALSFCPDRCCLRAADNGLRDIPVPPVFAAPQLMRLPQPFVDDQSGGA